MKKASGLAANPLADSPFFLPLQKATTLPDSTPPTLPAQEVVVSSIRITPQALKPKIQRAQKKAIVVQPRNRDAMPPRNHATVVSRNHTTIVSRVRKSVKEFGKEAATHRFTAEEKRAIADLIYTYKARGYKTSENEMTRIAVNFIIEDYRENGENSILDKVLNALNE